jgi:hypothetical protein
MKPDSYQCYNHYILGRSPTICRVSNGVIPSRHVYLGKHVAGDQLLPPWGEAQLVGTHCPNCTLAAGFDRLGRRSCV